MYRTLSELSESVKNLVERHGPEAECAAFIFTKDDVCKLDDDMNEVELSEEAVSSTLEDLGECQYIYDQCNEVIEDRINFILANNK